MHASGSIVRAVSESGAVITALDIVDPGLDSVVLDLSCSVRDETHVDQIVAALNAQAGCHVRKASDSVFLAHLGGKIQIALKSPLRNRADLGRVYTPGVARVCRAIADNPADARNLTIKRNTVAVVTDGTAVLGLGDIGPAAAMPVMEGKAALFKRFADVDAWPIALDTTDTDEIVRTVELIAPGFGGINLEDIAAPRCFEIERRLRERLDIPVFHDDQHGTAMVTLAALRNALRLVDKPIGSVRTVLVGAGAAGVAVAGLLMRSGLRDLVAFDLGGAIHTDRTDLSPELVDLARRSNPRQHTGTISEAMAGADVFIGLSGPDVITEADVAAMAPGAIVFAMANPDPEIDPVIAARHAAVVATGRSDYPNQINNVLAFPGLFRGLLDAGARSVTDEILLRGAHAIADLVGSDRLSSVYIIPSVFDPQVVKAVSAAVVDEARTTTD